MNQPNPPRLQLQLPPPLRDFRRDPPGVRLLALALCMVPFVVLPVVTAALVVGAVKGWW